MNAADYTPICFFRLPYCAPYCERQPENGKGLVVWQVVLSWGDWFSGCPKSSRQPETKKNHSPKQRVVFIISTTARLFRFHFYAAALGVVARSSGGIFRFAQLNIFGIHALFFQKRFHGLGAFFG